MKKLLLSAAILTSTLLISSESAQSGQTGLSNHLSKQEQPSEKMMTLTTNSLNEAIHAKRFFMERMFNKMDFSNIDLSTDIVITKKEPIQWDEYDSDGKYICTNSWRPKRYIFFRSQRTWVLEVSEKTDAENCQKDESYRGYTDLRAFKSVKNEDFKRIYVNSALEVQEKLIKDSDEIEKIYSKKMTFTETMSGFTAIVDGEDFGLEAGRVTNVWNIYKSFEDSYDVEKLEGDVQLSGMKIHSYSISNSPFVANYSKMFAGSNYDFFESSDGITLSDLVK